ERLLHVLFVDFAGAQENFVDGVGAIVSACRQHIAAFEVDDLDDAVLLESDGAGELLATELDETLDEIDLADFPFEIHSPRPFTISVGSRISNYRMQFRVKRFSNLASENIHQVLLGRLLHAGDAAEPLDQKTP